MAVWMLYLLLSFGIANGKPKAGYIRRVGCTDLDCEQCNDFYKTPIHFRTCLPANRHHWAAEFNLDAIHAKYLKFDCRYGRLNIQLYSDAGCKEKIYEKRQKCTQGAFGFYDYECEYASHDLRVNTNGAIETANANMIAIVVVIILLVCVIGMIAGYSVYRYTKRKKAEQTIDTTLMSG